MNGTRLVGLGLALSLITGVVSSCAGVGETHETPRHPDPGPEPAPQTPPSEPPASELPPLSSYRIPPDPAAPYRATIAQLVDDVPPLARPLGDRWPVFIWGAPARGQVPVSRYEDELQSRGLCAPANILRIDGEVDRALKYRRARGYCNAVIAQTFGQVTSLKAPGHDEEWRTRARRANEQIRYPCLGAYRGFVARERQRVEGMLGRLTRRGIELDVMLSDWELWCRHKRPVSGRQTQQLNQEFARMRACSRCARELPAEYRMDPGRYLAGVEVIRGLVLREAIVAPFKQAYPAARAGNYFSEAIVRQSGPRPEGVDRAVGWYGSDLDFAMPVHYGWWMSYHNRSVGWNVFRLYLQNITENARNLEPGQFIVPWVARLVGPTLREEAFRGRSVPFQQRPKPPWPADSYREYLRHSMLRGCRTFCIFWPNQGREPWHNEAWREEVRNVMTVFREMMAHREILDRGRLLNLEDVPGEYHRTGVAVWSGVATHDRALIRAVSFSGSDEQIEIEVFGGRRVLAAPVEGRTYVLER